VTAVWLPPPWHAIATLVLGAVMATPLDTGVRAD
jgi:hypothetical protein